MKHQNSSGSPEHVCTGGGGCGGHCEDKYGPALRVPPGLLEGERKEDKPCLTPIDCVEANRCAGHCGTR
jgi:hypothetical protein